jgi:uncharacterized protein YfbU (UPF0304 family)
VELNKFERLLLMNQYRILSLLDQSNADHYDKLRDALENGYVTSYQDDLFAGIRDGLSVEQSAFVLEVMSMYDALQRSYDALDDRQGIEEERTKFPGFDSDFELAHVGYARFVVEREGRFSHLKPASADFISHTPMVDQYRRMTDVWKLAGNRYELTRDDITAILGA